MDVDAVQIDTEEAIAGYLFESDFVQADEDTSRQMSVELLFLVVNLLTVEEFAGLKEAYGA